MKCKQTKLTHFYWENFDGNNYSGDWIDTLQFTPIQTKKNHHQFIKIVHQVNCMCKITFKKKTTHENRIGNKCAHIRLEREKTKQIQTLKHLIHKSSFDNSQWNCIRMFVHR